MKTSKTHFIRGGDEAYGKIFLQVLIAVPIFLLEVLFLYLWFSKSYLLKKGLNIQRYNRRVREFREYQNKVREGKIEPDAEMKKFLKENQNIYRSFLPDILFRCAELYVLGIVGAIVLYTFTDVMWGKYSIIIIVFGWIVILAFVAATFFHFCREGRWGVTGKLDQYTEFFKDFKALLKDSAKS